MNKEDMKMISKYKKYEKEKEAKLKEDLASCDHIYPNKKSALVSTGEDLKTVRCQICDQHIDLNVMQSGELEKAVHKVINAIESIKVSEKKMPKELRRELGVVKLMLRRLPEHYQTLYVDTVNYGEYDCEEETDFSMQQMAMFNPMMAGMMANPAWGYQNNNGDKKKKKNNKKKKSYKDSWR